MTTNYFKQDLINVLSVARRVAEGSTTTSIRDVHLSMVDDELTLTVTLSGIYFFAGDLRAEISKLKAALSAVFVDCAVDVDWGAQ